MSHSLVEDWSISDHGNTFCLTGDEAQVSVRKYWCVITIAALTVDTMKSFLRSVVAGARKGSTVTIPSISSMSSIASYGIESMTRRAFPIERN